jgi:phenylacetate-CoA ligase
VKQFQEKKLRELVEHCYIHVPYYRNLFREKGLTPKDITRIEDLRKLPVLTKEEIIKRHSDFVADNVQKSELLRRFTSGSTGTPFYVYTTKKENRVDYINVIVEREQTNIDFYANFLAVSLTTIKAFLRWDRLKRFCYLHPSYIDDKFFPKIVDEIRKEDITALIGRPYASYALARYCIDNGISLPITSVISVGEPLFQFHRDAIKKAFSCSIFNVYGQKERTVRAWDCTAHKGMHLSTGLSIHEIAKDGRLIVTPLFMRAFPLLRYDTKDHVKLDSRKCVCGRTSPRIVHVKGRSGDVLLSKNGHCFNTYTIFRHLNFPQRWVKEAQFVQKKDGSVTMSIVPWSEERKKDISAHVQRKLRKHFPLKIRFVRKLSLTKGGKLLLIKSMVRSKYLNVRPSKLLHQST